MIIGEKKKTITSLWREWHAAVDTHSKMKGMRRTEAQMLAAGGESDGTTAER